MRKSFVFLLATALILQGMADEVRIPTIAAPLGIEDSKSREWMLAIQNEWDRNPFFPQQASPAAVTYPGLVPQEVARLDGVRVEIDSTVPRWHSTGLFINAGEPLTVKLPVGAEKWGLELRIGTTADDLSRSSKPWKRAPRVTVQLPLTNQTTVVSSPYGGLVYLVVPENLHGEPPEDLRNGSVYRHAYTHVAGDVTKLGVVPKKFKVEFSGAAKAPVYRRGETTMEEWNKADFRVPQFELIGKNVIFTLNSVCGKNMRDIEKLLEFWDGIFDAYAELADLPPRRSPERICADVQLISGFMHNGYPIMFHYDDFAGGESPFTLSRLRTEGNWGLFHEIGHNHQSADWTWSGVGEVTVNIFTLLAMERATGKVPRRVDACLWNETLGHIRWWVDNGRPVDNWKWNPFFSLEFFTRFHDVHGWEGFRRLFASYHNPEFGARPKSDQEKRDQFAVRLAKIYGENWVPVMEAWRLEVSEKAKEFCASYPTPNHPYLWTGLLTNNWDVARAAGVKAGNKTKLRDGDRILFIGDSITFLSTGATGFTTQFKRLIKEVKPEANYDVRAAGFNGRTVFAWRDMAKTNDKVGEGADWVFIMLGMNDLLAPTVRDTPGGHKLWKETYRELIRTVRERAKPRKIVLCDVTPYMDDRNSAMNRFAARLCMKQLDELAEEERCLRSRTAEESFKTVEWLRARGCTASLWSDWVHPRSFEGNAAILIADLEVMGDEKLLAAARAKQRADLEDLVAGNWPEIPPKETAWKVYSAGENFGGRDFPDLAVPECERKFLAGEGFEDPVWKESHVSPDYPDPMNKGAVYFAEQFVYSNNDTYYATKEIESANEVDADFLFSAKTFLGGPNCRLWVNGKLVGDVKNLDKKSVKILRARLKKGRNRILVRADFSSWSFHVFTCDIFQIE